MYVQLASHVRAGACDWFCRRFRRIQDIRNDHAVPNRTDSVPFRASALAVALVFYVYAAVMAADIQFRE